MCVLKGVTLTVIEPPSIVSDCFDVRMVLTYIEFVVDTYSFSFAFEITRISRILFAGTFLMFVCYVQTPAKDPVLRFLDLFG